MRIKDFDHLVLNVSDVERALAFYTGPLGLAGERVGGGELLDGPTHDFNLMWRRDAIAAELLHRPLVGPMLFFTEPGVHWVVHLIAGQAAFDGASGLDDLCSGDTAVLTGGGTRTRHALHGGGELLAIRIEAEGR